MDNSYMFEFFIYMLIEQKYLEFAITWKLLVSQPQVQTSSFRMFCAIVDRSEIRELFQLRNIEHGNHGISSCFRKKENKFLRLLYFFKRDNTSLDWKMKVRRIYREQAYLDRI